MFRLMDKFSVDLLDEAIGVAKVPVKTLVRGPLSVRLLHDNGKELVSAGILHLHVEVRGDTFYPLLLFNIAAI